MKPEDQNKAICEWLGITYHKPTEEEIKSGSYYQYEPDYLNDLNAMHEAESKLIPSECIKYADWLYKTVDKGAWHSFNQFQLLNATAAQRAEALLRTIGKWSDSTLHTKG